MKASFFKRISAYLIDYFIISLILTLITSSFSVDNSINKELNDVRNSYANEEITTKEYNEKVYKLNYKLQKSNLPVNAVSLVLMIGYYIIFGYLNKGQTLGKKLLKIKVVSKENSVPSIKAMILRTIFIFDFFTIIYNIIFVNFLDVNSFNIGYLILSYTVSLFIMVSFMMILYRKDGRGLHDMIAGTNVVEEVK